MNNSQLLQMIGFKVTPCNHFTIAHVHVLFSWERRRWLHYSELKTVTYNLIPLYSPLLWGHWEGYARRVSVTSKAESQASPTALDP